MYEYTNNGPVDSSIDPDISTLKNKSVIITGGTNLEVHGLVTYTKHFEQVAAVLELHT
jgi:hypothetical protein